GVKKEELIYKILDFQAANPETAEIAQPEAKQKRLRIQPNAPAETTATGRQATQDTLFPDVEEKREESTKEESPRDNNLKNDAPVKGRNDRNEGKFKQKRFERS